LLLNVVYFYAVPSEGLANVPEVGAAAAEGLFGGTAAKLLTTLIALALISAVSAMVMAGPRVYASMAADGALPKRLAWHSARGVPAVAVVVQGGLAIVFVLIGTLPDLIDFVGFTLAISAAITVGGLFIMRRRKLKSTFRTFGYPVTPIVFIALSAWIAYARIDMSPRASGMVGLLLVVGGVVYVVLEHSRKIADLTARVEAVETKRTKPPTD
jgi:APA family basic amino acid/polyamine antiporter